MTTIHNEQMLETELEKLTYLGLGKVPLPNEKFWKLPELSVNEQ